MINLWVGSEDFDPGLFTINEKARGV